MSDVANNATDEASPIDRLDIPFIGPADFRELIDLAAEDTNLVVCGVGPSGIGKSHIIHQAAEARGLPFANGHKKGPSLILNGPQMSATDIQIPTIPRNHESEVDATILYFDGRISRIYEQLLAHEEVFKETGKRNILLIEEINRTRDPSVTAALFTMLGDRRIGSVRIPDYVQIVVLMNPSDGAMRVNGFEADPAMRRRITIVAVVSNVRDFLNHARSKQYHKSVVSYIEAQPKQLYDEMGARSGKVFACPANWDKVSRILKVLDARKKPLYGNPLAHALISGNIGITAANRFEEFLRDSTVVIAPSDVLENYAIGSRVREAVQKAIPNRTDMISELCAGIASHIFSEKKPPATFAKQLSLFLMDLKEEQFSHFLKTHIPAEGREEGNRVYAMNLSQTMARHPDFGSAARRQRELEKTMKERIREEDNSSAN